MMSPATTRWYQITCVRERNGLFRSRTFVMMVALAFVSAIVPPSILNAQDDPRATNIRYDLSEKKITIFYDLIGEPGETYRVTLHVKRENDKKFIFDPHFVVGDIGKDTSPGRDRKIVWDLYKDSPGGLNGTGYYFTITVEKPSSNFLWWAGAIVVSSGIMGLLIFSSSGEKATSPSFPPPPGRP